MSAKDSRGQSRRSFPAALLIILLFAMVAIASVVFFRVENISVLGASDYSKDQIIGASGIKKGASIMLLSEKKIAEKISDNLINVNGVTIKKELPSSVSIIVNESAAIACINYENKKLVIDSSCRVLGGVDPDGLIEIIGIEPVNMKTGREMEVVEADSVRLIYLKKVLSAFESNNASRKVSWLDVSNISNITFDFDDDFFVELGSGENADYKILKLVKVWEQLEEGDSGKIDISSDGETIFVPN